MHASIENYGVSSKNNASRSNHQNSWIRKAEDYLNAIKFLKVSFTQNNPDGSISSGKVYLSRPDKMRIEYHKPSKLLVLSDGQYLIQYDPEVDETSRMELELTPASIFLTSPVRFSGAVRVADIQDDQKSIHIRVVKVNDEGAGALTFVFQKSPFDLMGWIVLDSQGQRTTVHLSKEKEFPKTLNYSLFRLHANHFKE